MRGSCLRHLRTRAGLRASEIARELQLNAQHLTRLERGDQEIRLSLAQWYQLSKLLGVPIDKFPR